MSALDQMCDLFVNDCSRLPERRCGKVKNRLLRERAAYLGALTAGSPASLEERSPDPSATGEEGEHHG